jgi:hypothetical protein
LLRRLPALRGQLHASGEQPADRQSGEENKEQRRATGAHTKGQPADNAFEKIIG